MSIAIKDIPDETWNKLREDYRDELATMTSIEEDELNCMIHNSKEQESNDDASWERYYIQSKYMQKVDALVYLYHFETIGWDNNLRCITFTRTTEQDEIHEVTLEDHRDDEGVHDWLIFSICKDCIKDWDGYKEDGQYPLELGEYKLFAELISVLEQLYPFENS